jgi:phosphatidylserine decarboxylase
MQQTADPDRHAAQQPSTAGGVRQRCELAAPMIAPEGWPYIAMFVIGSGVVVALSAWLGGAIGWAISGAACLALCVWCVWFFRDPQRTLPQDADALICPADGKVVAVDDVAPPPELGLDAHGWRRISIFMNVFNVHVNRSPAEAVVGRVHYRPGKFFNASLDKASEHNERCSLLLRTPDGGEMVVVQIAGLIARRIVCRVKEGDALAAGQRFGIIRFGSRVDVFVRASAAEPAVRVGDMVQAGATVIGRRTRSGGA